MTRREIGLSMTTFTVGLAMGALLYRQFQPPPKAPPVAHEETVTEDEPPDDPRAVPEPSPVPDADAPPKEVALTRPDAAPAPESRREKSPRLHLRDLFIHPVLDDRVCVNVAPGGTALELLACRGHKGTERWTFVEDPDGTSRIHGRDGDCMHIGPLNGRGESTLELALCTSDTPKFRYTESRQLEEAHSGQCVTARTVDKRAPLILAACDPNARTGVQTWAVTP
jgi:hypothetical protein